MLPWTQGAQKRVGFIYKVFFFFFFSSYEPNQDVLYLVLNFFTYYINYTTLTLLHEYKNSISFYKDSKGLNQKNYCKAAVAIVML